MFLDICEGAGIAAACGLRPFFAVLLTGALASGDLGVELDRRGSSSFGFLEKGWFLVAIAAILVLSLLLGRRLRADTGPLGAAIGGLGLGLGAVEFGGIMDGGGHSVVLGIVAGLACAALAQACTRGLLSRAASRLDAAARAALPLYADGAGLVLAGLSILVPPVSLVALAALVWLGVQSRRRGEAKYAGLRVLR